MSDHRLDDRYDLLCFSHHRWDVIAGRPQHVLGRAAAGHRVFFVEPPIFDRAPAHLSLRRSAEGVLVVQPTLPKGTPTGDVSAALRELVDNLVDHLELVRYVLWFSTPGALPFAHQLAPCGVVYDRIDTPPGARGVTALPTQLELRLLGAADVVFTGLADADAVRDHHENVHAFPSDRWFSEPTWDAMERVIDAAIASRAAALDELAPRRTRGAGVALSL